MLPTSALALAFVLGLLPGYVYLRGTELVRPPVQRHGLMAALEVIASGAAISALVLGAAAVIWPSGLSRVVKISNDGVPSADDVRWFAIVIILLVVISVVSARITANVVRRRRSAAQGIYNHSVWTEAFTPDKHRHRYLLVELDDQRLIEGLSCAWEFNQAEGARDLMLEPPLYFTIRGGQRRAITTTDRVIIPERHIRTISVVHDPRV